MAKMVNVGFGNVVAVDRIIAVMTPDSAQTKRVVAHAKETEKFPALIYVGEVNGEHPENAMKRKKFDELIPIYPNKKLKLETVPGEYTMRIMEYL